MINPIEQIIKRQNKYEPNGYINLFRGDDLKKLKDTKSIFLKNSVDLKKIKNSIDDLDESTYGLFFQFNPLNKARRRKEDITKLIYVFIDLDNANEEHNQVIIDNLKKNNISYSYNAKSGHGFHFLIPIELETSNESKIKGFLTYLKNNVCDKVDISTSDNGRLLRIPESFHKKDKVEKQLKTLHSHYPTKKEIEINNKKVLNFQEEQKKGKADLQYSNSINRRDIFFNHILTNRHKWNEYYIYLNESEQRNNIFIKNLGIFLSKSPELTAEADNFLNLWESSRIPALHGWIKKSIDNKMTISYHELLKWSKKHSLTEFEKKLKEQLKTSFLDKYEIYYLEDEKKENNTLLYYPEKNYYLQKSLQEVLVNIYYDCTDRGIDLPRELKLDLIDDWEDMSFKTRYTLILNAIHAKIDQEKRVKLVYNINYEPSKDKFIYHDSKKSFNTYNSTELWDYNKKESKYHFPKIQELLENLTGNNIKSYNWFNKWLAWQIQNPTEKLPTAVILQGRQGSGKGTFKNLILDSIFGRNCQEINQTHLESAFNEYLLGKQIIVANEVMHNENRQTLPNVLKNLVTDPEITISRKFRKEIVGRNYTHWIFCTNSDNPIKIDEDDRRYSVFFSEKLRLGLGHEIRKNIEYELKQYISYLKSIKVIFDEVSEPIITEAKKDIIELNKNSVQKFFEYLEQFKTIPEVYSSIYNHLQNFHLKNDFGDGESYIQTDSFYLLYDKWCQEYKERGVFNKQNFSKILSSKKCFASPKWDKDKNRTFRMYNVKDIEKLMTSEIK